MDVNLQPSGFNSQGTYTPDNLIAGNFPIATKQVTIKSGNNLVRGTVLEEGTAGDAGKFFAVTTAANAKYILAEDCNATGGDKVTVAYLTGQFNSRRVTLGTGPTLAAVTTALEARNIYLVDTVSA